jgi:hypothetical protein
MNAHTKKLLNITLISLLSGVSTATYATNLQQKLANNGKTLAEIEGGLKRGDAITDQIAELAKKSQKQHKEQMNDIKKFEEKGLAEIQAKGRKHSADLKKVQQDFDDHFKQLTPEEFAKTKKEMVASSAQIVSDRAASANSNWLLRALAKDNTLKSYKDCLNETLDWANRYSPLTVGGKKQAIADVNLFTQDALDFLYVAGNAMPKAYIAKVEQSAIDFLQAAFDLAAEYNKQLIDQESNSNRAINQVNVYVNVKNNIAIKIASEGKKAYLKIKEQILKEAKPEESAQTTKDLAQINEAFLSLEKGLAENIVNPEKLVTILKSVQNGLTLFEETLASAVNVAILSLETANIATNNRMSSVSPAAGDENETKLGLWASGLLNSSKSKKDEKTLSEASYTGFGATIGLDATFNEKFIIGLAYTMTSGNLKFSMGDMKREPKISAGIASLYGKATLIDQLSFNANVKFGGIKAGKDEDKLGFTLSDFEGKFVYDVPLADNVFLQPYLGAGYTNIGLNNESKQSLLETFQLKDVNVPTLYNKARVILGASLSTDIINEDTTITPKLTIGGAIALGGGKSKDAQNIKNQQEVINALVSSVSEGLGSFFKVGVSGNVSNKNGLEFGLGADAILSKKTNNYSGYLKLGISF